MTCERYWREGVVLVERGLPDPHRADCADCTAAHAARQELVQAVPLVGAGYTGDPHWQANVWRRLAGENASRPRSRWLWWLDGALAMACAVLLWFGPCAERAVVVAEERPSIKRIASPEAMRSETLHTGEGVRVEGRAGDEILIYRDEILIQRCPQPKIAGCSRDELGPVVELHFDLPGTYRMVVARQGSVSIVGRFDHDMAAIERTNGALAKNEEWPVH